MQINCPCPECNTQGFLQSRDLLQNHIFFPPKIEPSPEVLAQNLRAWLDEMIFSKHFQRKGKYVYFGNVVVALECHACLGRGYTPSSNLSLCSKLLTSGELF